MCNHARWDSTIWSVCTPCRLPCENRPLSLRGIGEGLSFSRQLSLENRQVLPRSPKVSYHPTFKLALTVRASEERGNVTVCMLSNCKSIRNVWLREYNSNCSDPTTFDRGSSRTESRNLPTRSDYFVWIQGSLDNHTTLLFTQN